jgi:hypothetical protein
MLAAAIGATTISPAAAAPSTADLTAALDELERQQRFAGGPLAPDQSELWPWTVIDEVVIKPNEPTDVKLFRFCDCKAEAGKWPNTLAIFSMGWAWREDTRLHDCAHLVGCPADDVRSEVYTTGVWVKLKADGHTIYSGAAANIAGPRGLGHQGPLSTVLQPPIAAKSKFELNVNAPAMPLTQPVTLQFYLCGVVAIEEWLRGGVPVPTA